MAEDNTEFFQVNIISNYPISDTSCVLRFKKVFSFQAGQVIGITTSPAIPPRLYSVSSAESNAKIEILYKVVKEGELTPKLHNLRQGDLLYITSPFGKFIPSEDPSYYIATGTGIAPFLSMIRSGYKNCIKLIHGSRDIENFYEADYFRSILRNKYVQCYTGNEKYVGFRGRVTAYINQTFGLDPGDKYYLCGSAEMVVETREILISKGIPFQNILSEIYF